MAIINTAKREIVVVGSITKARIDIAVVGKPMPKNPLTAPANKKILANSQRSLVNNRGAGTKVRLHINLVQLCFIMLTNIPLIFLLQIWLTYDLNHNVVFRGVNHENFLEICWRYCMGWLVIHPLKVMAKTYTLLVCSTPDMPCNGFFNGKSKQLKQSKNQPDF